MERDTQQTLLAAGGTVAAAAGLRYLLRRRHRMDFRGRTVVISGGSRGLGLVLARHFASEGANLVLLARTEDDLATAKAELQTHATDVLALPCDVRDREGVERAIAEATERFGWIDVLIHDAGVIQAGPEEHLREEDYRESLGVHFWGAYYLTEAVRPHLPRDGSARIAYITSIGGRVAVPHLAAYSAGKFALVGYADAMRAELAEHGVRVTTVIPGLIRTGSPVNAMFKGQHEKEYAWFSIANANPLLSADPDRTARQIVEAVRYGDPTLTITLPAKLAVIANGIAPSLVGTLTTWADRLLPDATGSSGDEPQTGWESFSKASPSILTRPSDTEVPENNELRGHPPPAVE